MLLSLELVKTTLTHHCGHPLAQAMYHVRDVSRGSMHSHPEGARRCLFLGDLQRSSGCGPVGRANPPGIAAPGCALSRQFCLHHPF